MTDVTGGCLCGAVQFTVPASAQFCAHCHCRWCRKAHGAAYVTWLGYPEHRLRLAAGTNVLQWYRSSSQSRRGFCRQCGTSLFYASSVAPGEIHVARACIDGDVEPLPACHVFVDHAEDWASLDEALPRYDSDAPGLAKYSAIQMR